MDGIPVDEFHRLNADPTRLVQDGNYDLLERENSEGK